MTKQRLSDMAVRNVRAWAANRPDMSGSQAIIDAVDELLERRAADEPGADAKDAARYRWLRDDNAYVPEEEGVRGGEDLDRLCDDGRAPNRPAPQCWCHKCSDASILEQRMILCPECGNKRCPKASDHALACTRSNEPGQPGSVYA